MPTSMPASPPLREPTFGRSLGARASRADWVDAAKGMGIVLVVAGHVMDGLMAAHLADRLGGWPAAYFAIYSFHMPLFFLLAGLFVTPRLAADAGGFVRSAWIRIAWPYLLWSLVQLAVIDALGAVVNTPSSLDGRRAVSLLWEPTSQFWFLQALLVLHLFGAALLPRVGVLPFLMLMLGARVLVEWIELPHWIGLPARFGIFYAAGVAVGPRLLERFAARRPDGAVPMAAAAIWLACALPVYLAGLSHWSVTALPAALAGTVAVLALAARPHAGGVWSALGRASMAIFVLHVLFAAGARIVLHQGLGIDQPAALFVLACAAGIAGPCLVRDAARRAGLSRALGLG
jgi:fucose 4-O-acetylase-like acetyltransferase